MRNNFVFLLIITLLFSSCKKDKFKINPNKVDLDIKIERFDRDLENMDTLHLDKSIVAMQKKYGDFFNVYSANVIMLGSPDSIYFKPTLKAFLRDSMIREVYKESQRVFGDVSDIQAEVNTALKYIKYYFPNQEIPRVAMHISGFNQSVITTNNFVSISIDNYLGADYAIYKHLQGIYDYQLTNMTREKVAPDILLGYIMSEFPVENSGPLLNYMLSRGKIYYLQSILFPNRTESDLMGYTEAQYKWCEENKKTMWRYLIENKKLYTTSQIECAKFINPSPFTIEFTQESPGQAVIWLGWQIVKSYMNSNSSVTLPELMANKNYQEILEKSNFKP